MTISYTANFGLPLLESGSDGWDSTINGAFEDLDTEIFQAQNPMVNRAGDIMVSIVNGMVIQKRFSTTGG